MSGIANTLVAMGSGQTFWMSNYAVGTATTPYASIVTSSGELVFGGIITLSTDQAMLVKYTSTGDISWQRNIGSGSLNSEYINGVRVSSAGDIVGVGYTSTTGYEPLIVKYNSSGTIQWQRTLGVNATNEYGLDVDFDSSGNIYVVINSDTSGGNANFLTAKYDTNGTLLWQRLLGGSRNDIAYSVKVDGSGNIFSAGYTEVASATDDRPLIVKRDSTNAIQWQKYYSFPPPSTIQSIDVDGGGNIYAGGAYKSAISAYSSAFIIKTDSTGASVWQRTLNSGAADEEDVILDIMVASDGYLYACGATRIGSQYNGLVAKYDSSGSLIFQRTINGGLFSIVCDSVEVYGGAMYLTMRAQSVVSGAPRCLLAKLPSNGTKTGVYAGVFPSDSITYAASSLTASTASNATNTATLTDAAGTYVSATSTLPESALTQTRSLVSVT